MGCTSSQPEADQQGKGAAYVVDSKLVSTGEKQEQQQQPELQKQQPEQQQQPQPQEKQKLQEQPKPEQQQPPTQKQKPVPSMPPKPDTAPMKQQQQQQQDVSASKAPVSKLRTDCKVRDAYKLGKVIGTGGFSVVRSALDKLTGTEYACKIMSLPTAVKGPGQGPGVISDKSQEMSSDAYKDINIPCENSREDIFKEIDILCGLNHENVLFLKEYFEEDNKVYLITEILTGGELLDAVLQRGSYNENEARSCFVQLLRGIEYLHSRGVVHRDLKLENLLLKTKEDITAVKIADFGLAKMAAGEAMQTICGTPQYVAPEVIQGLKITQYGPGVDMWGAGIVLFILLGGYPPFYSESEPHLFEQIRKGRFSFDDPVWDGVTDSAKDLICKLLNVDPAKRLTAAAALQHSWLAPGSSKVDPSGPTLAGTQVNLKKHFSHRGAQQFQLN